MDALIDYPRLREVCGLFLRLGLTAFGGPAAHIALMEEEVVRRRGWLTHEEFLDLLGATNLIPGPNSTEMAIHIGHRRAGWLGLVLAGISFLLPAALLVTGFAWAYVKFGQLPSLLGVLYGVKPVMIAVVAQALWTMGQKVLKRWPMAMTGIAAVVLNIAGLHELLLLLLAGVSLTIYQLNVRRRNVPQGLVLAVAVQAPTWMGMAAATSTAAIPFTLPALFFFFLKIGSVLFGSGYVLLAFLRADLVDRWRWLTESQLLDAIAVGQVTPGPLFTAATFIGYVLGGPWAALLATVGIFLPAFVFVALSGPLIPRIRASPAAGAFLDGVNAASLALMAVVSWDLGRSALVDGSTTLLACLSGVLLIRYRVSSLWLILGGALAGLIRMEAFP